MFSPKIPSSIFQHHNLFVNTTFNQNRPNIFFFIHHHLICSHLAVVDNGAAVSMETAQMIFDHYQIFFTRD